MSLAGEPLNESDYAKLNERWIDRETADRSLLRRVHSIEGAEILGRNGTGNYAGLAIPYKWPGEQGIREYRIRRDLPEYENGKPKGKYLAPPGRGNLLYVPLGVELAWLTDATLPIVYTEGEFKTIALDRAAWAGLGESAERPRFLTLGLPGVWNWRGVIGKVPDADGNRVPEKGPIPDLSRISHDGRVVTIVFDRDIEANRKVADAKNAFARELTSRGGDVRIFNWPEEHTEAKGVDDLLAVIGPERVIALIENAADFNAKATQSQRLAEVISGKVELFQAPDDRLYATIRIEDHKETWAIRSQGFRRWLALRYYREEHKPLSATALQDTVQLCEAQAKFEGSLHDVGLRVMKSDGAIYLDLANSKWSVVKVTSTGWHVEAAPEVKFRRSKGMAELPRPLPGGSLEQLRDFLNVGDDTNWVLLVAWLLACLNPTGPFPILILQGEQGSAKSTTARVLKSLVDPGKPPLRSSPRDERDMMIAASNALVLSYDNLSGTQPWLSDALCRLSTGGGFATRELHSDNEETLFEATRPVILNGIDDVATNPDLADRAVIVTLPAISAAKRKSERSFWNEFEQQRPYILGALLDAVSVGLKTGAYSLANAPRMADFAEWISSCCYFSAGSGRQPQEPRGALPFTADEFLNIYLENRSEAISLSIESSPVGAAVQRFMVASDEALRIAGIDIANDTAGEFTTVMVQTGPEQETDRRSWKGTVTQLLKNLIALTPEDARHSREWPKEARSLGSKLRRVAAPLRSAGIDVAFSKAGHTKARMVTVSPIPCSSVERNRQCQVSASNG